ncbi:hypothetical protein HFO49_35690 [Rhizobium leguminosarum]|uniref:hypothetical protein n=1 Tax=Rhizobium leguminosarum TaxID=384 RepID=UPI001C9796C3|nr:hypothetical protein [Rhizobium leguminosarum]MBY5592693.1 hypothetical protein [Rhizobium leguminosarum]MBY5605575.1 hypothetical protein [Rhizobium leguminosarum]
MSGGGMTQIVDVKFTRNMTLIVACVGVFSLARAAEITCDQLQPVPGDIGYQKRSGDARCEGAYASPVGADGLDLISIENVGQSAVPVTGPILSVSAPKQIGLPVHVRAVAIPLRTYYRMDATLEPGASLKWPVSIMRSLNLEPSDIGVVGWIDSGAKREFVPLSVVPEGSPPNPDASDVEIRLRPQVSLERVLWRTVEEGQLPSQWNVLADRPVAAGEQLPLTITKEAMAGKLDIRAKRPDSDDWLALTIAIWRASK